MDVTEMRALAARESRTLRIPVEVRSEEGGSGPVITGHAAVFDRWSDDLGGFKERIARGAFRKALAAGQDVVLTLEHNNEKELASTRDGSLTLKEDARGLLIRADIDPAYYYAETVLRRVEKGTLAQMSFAFRVAPEGDEWDDSSGTVRRTVYEVSSLHDVTLTVNPAYRQTQAAVERGGVNDREINVTVNIDGDRVAEAVARTLTKTGAAPMGGTEPGPDGPGGVADPNVDSGASGGVGGDPPDTGGQDKRHLPAAWRRDQMRRTEFDRQAATKTTPKEGQ